MRRTSYLPWLHASLDTALIRRIADPPKLSDEATGDGSDGCDRVIKVSAAWYTGPAGTGGHTQSRSTSAFWFAAVACSLDQNRRGRGAGGLATGAGGVAVVMTLYFGHSLLQVRSLSHCMKSIGA